MSMRTITRSALATLALTAATALTVSAQSARSGWAPWLGCWQAEGAPEGEALCVRPAATEDGAVEILRVEGPEILAREVVWTDGTRHETVRDDCTGWETGTFSQDGQRVLLRSSHTCEDGSVQNAGGIMAMAEPDVWLDVRYMDVGGEPAAWVQRYEPAPSSVARAMGMEDASAERSMRLRASRVAAAQALDIADVTEASDQLPAEAVEAWVAETGQPFRLDSDALVTMDDAGVAGRVIDVMVAVSNPDVFALAPGEAPERVQAQDSYRGARRTAYRGWLGYDFYDPFYYRQMYYGYSPFGYSGWGYHSPVGGYYSGGYYGYRPTIIQVEPRNGGGGGRAIAGRGYRRPGSSGGGDTAQPRRPAVKRTPSSGSGSSASPASRPSPPPRKAKPRPKGGGGGGGGLL